MHPGKTQSVVHECFAVTDVWNVHVLSQFCSSIKSSQSILPSQWRWCNILDPPLHLNTAMGNIQCNAFVGTLQITNDFFQFDPNEPFLFSLPFVWNNTKVTMFCWWITLLHGTLLYMYCLFKTLQFFFDLATWLASVIGHE